MFEFSLPTRATAVPSGPDWLHEIKYDATGSGWSAMVTVGPGMAIDDLSDQKMEISMTANISETAKDVVRRNTEEVQGRGNWALFDELFADNFFDHTPQPGGTRDKAGVLVLYKRLREAFPDFTPDSLAARRW